MGNTYRLTPNGRFELNTKVSSAQASLVSDAHDLADLHQLHQL